MKNSREQSLQDLVDTQQSNGNWDYDPYMHGLLNGMLLGQHVAYAAAHDIDGPAYRDAPEEWVSDINDRQAMLDLHAKHPALLEAYNHYRFLLNIINEDKSTKVEDIHRL